MTHAVLIAATAARRCRPTVGESRPSTAMTNALARLHAMSSPTRIHNGVGEIRCARCSQGMARIATGPDAKTRSDAPISLQTPLILLTEGVSGPVPDNLTGD